jgi:hypothetical protein
MRTQRGFASGLVALSAALVVAGCGGSSTNRTPSANAGADQTARRNATVTLDGSASTDADGDSLAYRWVQTSGTPVTLSSSTSSRPTFTTPDQSGALSFSLTTNDGKVDSATDDVTVVVGNTAPAAISPSTIAVGLGQMAVLDATASTDADGDPLTYTWTQLSGPAVEISSVAPGVRQFRVPITPQVLVFSLIVSDGELSSSTITVTINVTVAATPPLPPSVNAGQDAVVARRETVSLNGSAWDLNGDAPLSYAWEQVAGPTVTLSNATSLSPSFTAPATTAQLRFALRANDGTLTSEADEVVVDVRNFAPIVSNAAITPTSAYTTDTLVANAQVTDRDNDAVTTTYEWRRNGTLVSSQTSNTFPASFTSKNEIITVRMTVDDGQEQTTVDASKVILDSPAVVSAQTPPPTTLNYGATANFTVTATDADGDPIPDFEVAFGPAGFSVTPQGDVSWTAAGPLFNRVTDFNWGVRAIGQTSSLLSGTIEVTDAAREYPLRRTTLGNPIQHSGLHIADLDGDGDSEMLVGSALIGTYQAVYVLSRSGSTYQQSWVYPFDVGRADTYGDDIQAVTSADIDGDSRHEIYFSKGGELIRLDGVARREAARAELRCRGLEVADLDGNGSQELVCLNTARGYQYETEGRIVVLNASTLAELWSTPQLSVGRALAIGNVDGDAALEIVTSGGLVFDGSTHLNQWDYHQPFGEAVATGDMDGNGVEEIISAGYWSAVRAYSAVSQSIEWEFAPSPIQFASVTVADANGDGHVEAIAGSFADEGLRGIGYNTTTQQPELVWQILPQERGVSSIAVGDVDADGTNEVVWGAGMSTSLRDQIVIAGFTPAISVKWQSVSVPELTGPFSGGELARIGAGATRLMFSVSRSDSFSGMRAIALTPMTGEVESSASLDIGGTSSPAAIAVADYDNDNVDELFMGGIDGFSIYDLATESVEWEPPSPLPAPNSFATRQADMNGDGYADLVGLTQSGHVEIFDVHAQSLIWRSTLPTHRVASGFALSDLDNDGEPEMVVVLQDRIIIYGRGLMGVTFVERASIPHQYAVAVAVADLDGDSEQEIYVLNYPHANVDSILNVFDADLQLVRSVDLGVTATALFVEKSAFARKNLLVGVTGEIFTSPGYSELWAIDPITGADVWHSPPLVGTVSRDSLYFVDVDGDGDDEISFGNTYGMYHTR